MVEPVQLRSLADMTLANAARLAFDNAGIELTAAAQETLSAGRRRFQAYLDASMGGYVYGCTTAPGARAKVLLSSTEAARQSESVGNFLLMQAGLGGEMLPERCVRIAVLARLSNAMTGRGKLRPETALAIARLAGAPPPVPLQTAACSGEVIPLTWLVAPLAKLPLAMGEAMALVNGSPFATAMVSDVALTMQRRLRIAEVVFALSSEAAGCPAAHFNPRLAEHWPDPFYRDGLRRLSALLEGSEREQLTHQAPTSWRVLPNVLGALRQAVDECATAAAIGLRSLKDNPTFLYDDDGARADVVASSSGYHDHRSGKAIDGLNNVMLDVGVLASRQIGRFLDGEGLNLPPLLGLPGDRAGIEYTAWGLTEPLAAARRAAEPTTLDMGLHDPSGNQSDVVSLAFTAYAKHREAARALDACLASVATIAILALDLRSTPLPPKLRGFCKPLLALARSGEHRIAACGEPLRQIREHLRQAAEDLPSGDFDALF
jgi:histidine ammonia-lyase